MAIPVMIPKLTKFPNRVYNYLGIVSFKMRLVEIRIRPAVNARINLPIDIVQKFFMSVKPVEMMNTR